MGRIQSDNIEEGFLNLGGGGGERGGEGEHIE